MGFFFRAFLCLATFIWLLEWSVTSWADPPKRLKTETTLYYFGGGGERTNERNMFDLSLEEALKLAREKKWKGAFQTDLGHPSTKKLVAALPESERARITDFNEKNFKSRLATLTRQIDAGDFKNGEQLMVIVSTHGYGRDLKGQNLISLAGDGVATSLSEPIRQLVAAAEKKGVRLGLVLLNCFSGDLRQEFGLSKNVCAISGSDQRRLATGAAEQMVMRLRDTRNLEHAFLEGRHRILQFSQPAINTEAGEKTARDLAVFGNYVFHEKEKRETLEDRLCSNDEQRLDHLLDRSSQLQTKTQEMWMEEWQASAPAAGKKLVEGLKRLKKRRDYEFIRPQEKFRWGLNLSECFEAHRGNDPLFCSVVHADLLKEKEVHIRRRALLEADPQKYFSSGEGVKPKNKTEFEQFYAAEKKLFEDLIADIDKNLRNPAVRAIQQEIALQKFFDPKRIADAETTSRELTGYERSLHDAFYEHHSKEDKGPNPCRDFTLN